MVNWTTILIIAILFITADKFITVMNIKAVEKNFPNIDRYSIEKNPLARTFFEKTGLLWGTILYGIFSLATFFFAILLFYYPAKMYAPNNAFGVSFYIMCMVYSLVLMNNFYFFLRYSKLL